MTLSEKARYYYIDKDMNCAEAILLAANDIYSMGLSEDDVQLFTGFGGGMGCQSTCGALSGSIGVIGKLYNSREGLREICGSFVSRFAQELGCSATDCDTLSARYKTEETRCRTAVELAGAALEKFISDLENNV